MFVGGLCLLCELARTSGFLDPQTGNRPVPAFLAENVTILCVNFTAGTKSLPGTGFSWADVSLHGVRIAASVHQKA